MRFNLFLPLVASLLIGCTDGSYFGTPASSAGEMRAILESVSAVEIEDEPSLPAVIEIPMPVPLPGQLKPLPAESLFAEDMNSSDGEEQVSEANRGARMEPGANGYVNAIHVFTWTDGALYQVYTAPGQVTDLALAPDEDLVSISAGDTVRWKVGETSSGKGKAKRVHVLVKPIAPDLITNLVIATDRRVYHVELKSTKETYMASASWTYPADDLVLLRSNAEMHNEEQERTVAVALRPEQLRFGYRIEGDRPAWRPLRAFDDGRSVYIQFPQGANVAPPLFVVGLEGDAELVNYRVRGSYYVVDGLFQAAELRFGGKKQVVVRIARER